MERHAIILAAGKGTRMKSSLPKVLHKVCGKPMVQHLIDKLTEVGISNITVVVGHESQSVKENITGNVTFVEQEKQLGTAHAVMQTASTLKEKNGQTLILTGDTPLIEIETLQNLLSFQQEQRAEGVVLTTLQENPTGYGRIIRNSDNNVIGIVEEKDTSSNQKQIKEVNTGIFCIDNQTLFNTLPLIKNNNSQKEYYLTDLVSIFNIKGNKFKTYTIDNAEQLMGINDRVQLSQAEKYLRKQINEFHMKNGVTIINPENTYIDTDAKIGSDTVIEPGVVIKNASVIGKHCFIGAGSEISNSIIDNNTVIKQSIITDSDIGKNVTIGPFAHIRPLSFIQDDAKIGNFVELKKSTFGKGSKASHLSYIGDAEIGENVNFGCGSITVNYDGAKKHKTVVDNGAFIGCNANLIAPVTIEENSFIAAGSTIHKNVPKNALAIAREKQINKEGYATRFPSNKKSSNHDNRA